MTSGGPLAYICRTNSYICTRAACQAWGFIPKSILLMSGCLDSGVLISVCKLTTSAAISYLVSNVSVKLPFASSLSPSFSPSLPQYCVVDKEKGELMIQEQSLPEPRKLENLMLCNTKPCTPNFIDRNFCFRVSGCGLWLVRCCS